MNFEWTEQQQTFRQRVRDFIERELPPDFEKVSRDGPGSNAVTDFSMTFCAKLAAEGLLVPHWPAEWGGTGGTAYEHFILGEEMWMAGEPRGGQYMNVNWIGTTLLKYGTEEQKKRYIPPMAAGKTLWCQGFSEPGAGSDLASLRTSATKINDKYVINGQKIWTSYAAKAETCFLLARTAPGKSGITIFLIPMTTPGITVRPIPSLVGEGDIHEVFFDNVEVPESSILGKEGEAWTIVTYGLSNERVGIPRYALAKKAVNRAVDILKERGEFKRADIRRRAAQALAYCEAARMLTYRVLDDRARGLPPSPEASIARTAVGAAERNATEFVVEYVPEAMSGADDLLLYHHQRAIVAPIASGAAEIQLNLIASQLLHLPR